MFLLIVSLNRAAPKQQLLNSKTSINKDAFALASASDSASDWYLTKRKKKISEGTSVIFDYSPTKSGSVLADNL